MIAGIALRVAPYVIAAAVVAAGWVYVSHLRSSVAALRVDLATAQASLAVEQTIREIEREQNAAALAAVERERTATVERERRRAAARESIASAPETDDGPVAPVLERAIDSLRRVP